MISRVFRRLERLELRASADGGIKSIPIGVLLVDAEKGLTGVLMLDGAKPTMNVPPPQRRKPRSARIWRAERAREYLPISQVLGLYRERSGEESCWSGGIVSAGAGTRVEGARELAQTGIA
jgi:hypothetical protein